MDLKDLYRDVIVDHNRSPRNFGVLADATRSARGVNPLCGDRLDVFLQLEDGMITDARFEGSGCAISVASASLMTEALKGASEDDARALFADMHELLAGDADTADSDLDRLGKLAALSGVRAFPSRVKCASLCWHALKAALDKSDSVSTE